MTMRRLARLALGGALLTEAGMALHRFEARRRAFDAAARRAALLQRPLIVVGDPDAGMMPGALGRCASLPADHPSQQAMDAAAQRRRQSERQPRGRRRQIGPGR